MQVFNNKDCETRMISGVSAGTLTTLPARRSPAPPHKNEVNGQEFSENKC